MPRPTQQATGLKWMSLIGRIFFSLIFLIASSYHFTQPAIKYAADHGVPSAGVLVPLAGVLALLGGLSVLFGYRARTGAWLLILFLIPVTLTMHNFWAAPDAASAALQEVMFLKNLSMLGGAMFIACYGPGPISFDSRRKHSSS